MKKDMEPIEIIRAACIKTNPEIMELKFGCFVKGNYDEYLFTQSYKGSYCCYQQVWRKLAGQE